LAFLTPFRLTHQESPASAGLFADARLLLRRGRAERFLNCRAVSSQQAANIEQEGTSLAGRAAVLIVMAMALSGCALNKSAERPAPFSDNFTEDAALKPGWILYEPNPASSHAIGSDGLLLEASGKNGGSDLWLGSNFRASLLLQPVSPAANWTIITHFSFSPSVDFQAAGLVLTTQSHGFTRASKFHRFELSYQNRQNGLGVASYTNGPSDPLFARYRGKEVYLKLTKLGATYQYSYSMTGKTWISVSTITDPTPYAYVGLESIRQPWHGGPNVDSRPIFKSFCFVGAGQGDDVDAACR
jgi:hypothetical protein